MAIPEYKQCPKCGGIGETKASYPYCKWKEFRVVCNNCGFRTTPYAEDSDAKMDWYDLCVQKESMTDDG